MHPISLRGFAALCAALLAVALAAARPAQAQSYTLSTLYNFDGVQHGANPLSDLTADTQGNLYGTTSNGGSGGHGTVFEYSPSTGTLTTLVKFVGNSTAHPNGGANPYGGVLLDGAGLAYGTTYAGGSSHDGTLYQLNLSTHALTTRISFKGSNGTLPTGNLVSDGQGILYGVTQAGGSKGNGTIFKYNVSTHVLTTLYSFNSSSGTMPYAGVTLDGQGTLYGTTYAGGSANNGTLYSYNLTTKALTVLHSFTASDSNHENMDGNRPEAALTLDGAGNLYGTASQGGSSSNGTLFEYVPSSSTFSVLHEFANPDGDRPVAAVIIGSDGNLYGTTKGDTQEADFNGTVYEYNTGTGQLTTLVTFDGVHESQPFGGVYQDAQGNLYGTTAFSGSSNDGALYKLTPGP